MASFETAYQIVRAHEGGYQAYPEDSGNYNSLGDLVGTNWGISAPVYESWIGRAPTMAEMKAMTRAEAKAIYKSRFWDDINGDQINSQPLANILFDGRVNHGRTGTKLIQRLLNVAVDGIVGSQTLAAINNASPQSLFNAYKEARKNLYHNLAVSKPSNMVFLQGWLNRINSFVFQNSGGNLLLLGGAAIAFFLIYRER